MIKAPRPLVRRLRKAVRQIVRSRPALRKERRRLRRRSLHPVVAASIVRALPCFYLVIFYNELTQVPRTALTHDLPVTAFIGQLMAVWALMVMLHRSLRIKQLLSSPGELAVPYSLPIKNEEVFDSQSRQLLFSAPWLFLDFLVFGCLVAYDAHVGVFAWAAAVVFALAQAATAHALAWIFHRWISPQLSGKILLGLIMLPILWFIAEKVQSPALIRFVQVAFAAISAVTPSGWLAWGFQQAVLQGSTLGWLTLLLAPACCVMAWKTQQTRRADFNLETVFNYLPQESPGPTATDHVFPSTGTPVSDPEDLPVVEPSPFLAAKISAAFNQRLAAPPARAFISRGLFERWIAGFLSPRELVVLEVMQPLPSDWTRRWLVSAVLIASLAALHRLYRPSALDDIDMVNVLIPGFLLTTALLMSLPFFGLDWIGFRSIRAYQALVPIYVHYPAGFNEISRLYLKIGALRSLLAFPLIFFALHFILPSESLPWGIVTILALKATVVLLCVQPVSLLVKFSSGSNDTRGNNFAAVIVMVGVIVASLSFIGVAGSLFVVNGPWPVLAVTAGLAAVSFGFLAFYGTLYNRNFFDLATLPQK